MSMNIVYPSAAEYWLSHPLKGNIDEFSKPIHVMVPDVTSRKKKKDFVYHVQPKNLSERSFTKINPILSVCSPELCFLEAALSIKSLPKLAGAQVHSSVILSQSDANTFKKLGMMLTCDPQYQTKKLFHQK